MALVTYNVNDDGSEKNSDTTVILTATTSVFSSTSTNRQKVGYRFTGVAVANAATVRHAFLKVLASTIATSSVGTYTLKGEAADNAAAFTTTNADLSGRTLTTQSFSTSILYIQWDDHFIINVYFVFNDHNSAGKHRV